MILFVIVVTCSQATSNQLISGLFGENCDHSWLILTRSRAQLSRHTRAVERFEVTHPLTKKKKTLNGSQCLRVPQVVRASLG